MKMLKRSLYILPTIGTITASRTGIEGKGFEHIGGYSTTDDKESAQYYANLHAWEATSRGYGYPIFFGWLSNWSSEGPTHEGYLASLPGSIDIVSMWSGPFGLDEAKLVDKEIFQKKRGGKITVYYILHNIGTSIAPASVSEKVQAENPNASSEETTELANKATETY